MFGNRNKAFRRGSSRVTEGLLLLGHILRPPQKDGLTLLRGEHVLRTPVPEIRDDGIRRGFHALTILRKRPREQGGIIRLANEIFHRH